jgi:hypothetical protein
MNPFFTGMTCLRNNAAASRRDDYRLGWMGFSMAAMPPLAFFHFLSNFFLSQYIICHVFKFNNATFWSRMNCMILHGGECLWTKQNGFVTLVQYLVSIRYFSCSFHRHVTSRHILRISSLESCGVFCTHQKRCLSVSHPFLMLKSAELFRLCTNTKPHTYHCRRFSLLLPMISIWSTRMWACYSSKVRWQKTVVRIRLSATI